MEKIPPRLLLRVLEYLPEDDWLRVANLCRKLRTVLARSLLAKRLTTVALQWVDAPLLRALLLNRKWRVDDAIFGKFVWVCRRGQTSLIYEILQTERFLDAVHLITRLAVLEAWPRAMRTRDAATLCVMLRLGWGEEDRDVAELICARQGYERKLKPLRAGADIATEKLTPDEEAMLLTKGGDRSLGWQVPTSPRAGNGPWPFCGPTFYDQKEVTRWAVETWRHRADADLPMIGIVCRVRRPRTSCLGREFLCLDLDNACAGQPMIGPGGQPCPGESYLALAEGIYAEPEPWGSDVF